MIATACCTARLGPPTSELISLACASPGRDPSPLPGDAPEAGRPFYRYSVIPGGAYSVTELTAAQREDPLVKAHYAVFRPERLRLLRNPTTRSAYVSYRIGKQVFWTRQRLTIPAGELLITDGEHEARARCGNRLAERPQKPFRLPDPSLAELETLELPGPPELGLPASRGILPFPGGLRAPALPFVAQQRAFDVATVPGQAPAKASPADPPVLVIANAGGVALPLVPASSGPTASGLIAVPDPLLPNLWNWVVPELPDAYLEYQAMVPGTFSWVPFEPLFSFPSGVGTGIPLIGKIPYSFQPASPSPAGPVPEPTTLLPVLTVLLLSALYFAKNRQSKGSILMINCCVIDKLDVVFLTSQRKSLNSLRGGWRFKLLEGSCLFSLCRGSMRVRYHWRIRK
jgi:hypothetical protein